MVAVGPPGHPVTVSWPAVPGVANAELSAEVAAYPLTVSPSTAQLPIEGPSVTQDGKSVIITVPADRAVASLTLTDLVRTVDGADKKIRSAADLGGARLVVALSTTSSGPFDSPRFAIPAVGAQGLVPATLTGARLDFGTAPTLRFPPDTRARRVRISVATGDVPQEFAEQPIRVGTVTGTAGLQPTDLVLTGQDGSTAWASPGELTAGTPPASADLTVPLETALSAALASAPPGAPIATTFTMKGKAGSQVVLKIGPARGALLRRFPGVHTTVLTCDPTPPAGLQGLSTERPASVTGDLTVRYEGRRLLSDISDPLPGAQGGVGGQVVRDEPVLRAFPPAGYGALPLAMVGLVGRAGVDCALSVSIVRFEGNRPGEPLGPAATCQVAAGTRLGPVWLELPAETGAAGVGGGVFALSVRASTGVFLWAAREADRLPLARFAVADPDPEPAALRLGDATLCRVGAAGVHLPKAELPTALFTGTPPAMDCPLFVHVDLSDLELRYTR